MIKRRALWLLSLPMFIAALAAVPVVPAVAAPAERVAAPAAQTVPCRAFPETNQTVAGPFLQYWINHGGLAQQGYPLTGAFQEVSADNGQTYLVQYFERAVFEYHPDNQAPNDVLLSLLGRFIYQQKYPGGAPNQVPNKSPGFIYFSETKKTIGGGFLEYWQAHGGLAQQGYPISDEFDEVSPLDGKLYRVQYFERAVFEYHPNNDAGNRILLSQLGRFTYTGRYPGGISINQFVQFDCIADGDGDSIADDTDRCPDQPENVNGIFDADGCPDTIETLVDATAQDLDQFWQRNFDESNLPYSGPSRIVGYTQPIRTACGRAVPDNAFYCPGSNNLYYDSDFLMQQLIDNGDFAPAVIIAHEWGHLVQTDLGILDQDYPTRYIELQADCFAGAWAKHAQDDQDALIRLEEGDIEEGITAIFKAGDPEGTPWFDPQAHGSSQERADSFQLGLDQGVDACFSEE